MRILTDGANPPSHDREVFEFSHNSVGVEILGCRMLVAFPAEHSDQGRIYAQGCQMHSVNMCPLVTASRLILQTFLYFFT